MLTQFQALNYLFFRTFAKKKFKDKIQNIVFFFVRRQNIVPSTALYNPEVLSKIPTPIIQPEESSEGKISECCHSNDEEAKNSIDEIIISRETHREDEKRKRMKREQLRRRKMEGRRKYKYLTGWQCPADHYKKHTIL